MNEDQLIQTFFQSAKIDPSVILGIGDDAAIMQVPDGFELVISTDILLEGRHFPENYPPEDIASRAVGVCVSDLAAMGAIPKWVTLSLSLPEVQQSWLEDFSGSLRHHLQKYTLSLVGGDTVKGPLAITLTVLGVVETGQALRRDSVQLEDDIYVSGCLGGSAFALFKMLANDLDDEGLKQLFAAPSARVILGRSLLRLAHSCMDVSDGILLDLSRLLARSGVGAQVYLEKFPLHPAINDLALETQIKFATSGDDYELLFTAPFNRRNEIAALAKELELPLTRIGKVTEQPVLQTLSKGRRFDIKKFGYHHFS